MKRTFVFSWLSGLLLLLGGAAGCGNSSYATGVSEATAPPSLSHKHAHKGYFYLLQNCRLPSPLRNYHLQR